MNVRGTEDEMRKLVCFAVLVLAEVIGSASSVSADTIHFKDFTHSGSVGIDWLVSINDDASDVFTVKVGIADSSPFKKADITGIAFSIDGALESGLTTKHILDATYKSDFVRSYVGPNDKFGNGKGQVNFSGGTPTVGLFDAALGYRAGDQMLTSVLFTVSTLGGLLTLDDWTKFGVRAQSVVLSRSGDGSTKDWATRSVPSSDPSSAPPTVPTPSALVSLLGVGLVFGGVRLWRRR